LKVFASLRGRVILVGLHPEWAGFDSRFRFLNSPNAPRKRRRKLSRVSKNKDWPAEAGNTRTSWTRWDATPFPAFSVLLKFIDLS
jgi:hypothetical protein